MIGSGDWEATPRWLIKAEAIMLAASWALSITVALSVGELSPLVGVAIVSAAMIPLLAYLWHQFPTEQGTSGPNKTRDLT
jgi:hypothetical protein